MGFFNRKRKNKPAPTAARVQDDFMLTNVAIHTTPPVYSDRSPEPACRVTVVSSSDPEVVGRSWVTTESGEHQANPEPTYTSPADYGSHDSGSSSSYDSGSSSYDSGGGSFDSGSSGGCE